MVQKTLEKRIESEDDVVEELDKRLHQIKEGPKGDHHTELLMIISQHGTDEEYRLFQSYTDHPSKTKYHRLLGIYERLIKKLEMERIEHDLTEMFKELERARDGTNSCPVRKVAGRVPYCNLQPEGTDYHSYCPFSGKTYEKIVKNSKDSAWHLTYRACDFKK